MVSKQKLNKCIYLQIKKKFPAPFIADVTINGLHSNYFINDHMKIYSYELNLLYFNYSTVI